MQIYFAALVALIGLFIFCLSVYLGATLIRVGLGEHAERR